MMNNLMTMSLNNCINGSCGQRINQFNYFIILRTWFLIWFLCPYSITCSYITGIANVSHHNDSMSSIFLQFFTLFNNNIFVIKEFIFWELSTRKTSSCGGSLGSCQSNNTNFNTILKGINHWGFLLRKEITLTILRFKVSS